MSNPNFYFDISEDVMRRNEVFFDSLKEFSERNNLPVYIINKPLTDKKYTYNINGSFMILIPNHKIIFVRNDLKNIFEEWILDLTEDTASLANRYGYINNLGRSRNWEKEYFLRDTSGNLDNIDVVSLLKSAKIENNDELIWKCEQLLSLLLGSINDIDRIGTAPAQSILDKIKKRIILFDAEQTRFIFQEPKSNSHIIRIQGLSGTGKTELLLHKLKELYTQPLTPKIAVSCHNKVLAASLKERIPEFFDFMKIDQQIKWNDKLFCFHAWGSKYDKFSGLYRYICEFYEIPFLSYSKLNTFNKVCDIALENIKEKHKTTVVKYAFDFILLDESQDFPDSFFNLCSYVTKDKVYIAGDIFQSIFDDNILSSKQPDYLLNKCYRTDPKTLMLSHAIGMGLFESNKIRWLSADEWNACGYIYEEKKNIYTLKRNPIRRFEDIDTQPFNISFTEFDSKSIIDSIISIIDDIKNNHPTVKAQDICIIFPVGNDIYNYAYNIEEAIRIRFPEYNINKAYESKESNKENAIFLSNKNNVKGLEFAFVICVVPLLSDKKSKDNLIDRNAIYMSLTRSYIQSFLILNKSNNYIVNNKKNIQEGSDDILHKGFITGSIPNADEIEKLHQDLDALKAKPTINLSDILNEIFDELNVENELRKNITEIVQVRIKNINWDDIKIKQIVQHELAFDSQFKMDY